MAMLRRRMMIMIRCYACHAPVGASAMMLVMVVAMCVDGEGQDLDACAETEVWQAGVISYTDGSERWG